MKESIALQSPSQNTNLRALTFCEREVVVDVEGFFTGDAEQDCCFGGFRPWWFGGRRREEKFQFLLEPLPISSYVACELQLLWRLDGVHFGEVLALLTPCIVSLKEGGSHGG